ncbi:MAG: Dyp-type peroxidase domain-containing protein [Ornithinimicrobium sp.]
MTSRRALVGGSLLSLGAAGAGAAAAHTLGEQSTEPAAMPPPTGEIEYAFGGDRQPGIAEDPQPWSTLVGFDLTKGADRERVRRLMRIWTDDISRLMAGRGTLTDQEPELAERASGLTVTVGWGPHLFEVVDLDDVRPHWAKPLPEFEHDALDPAYSGGDLVLQIGSHSPITVAHAQRQLTTSAAGLATPRWVQPGFREPMEYHGWSMRNLLVRSTEPRSHASKDPMRTWCGSGLMALPVGSTGVPWWSGVSRWTSIPGTGWDAPDAKTRLAGTCTMVRRSPVER